MGFLAFVRARILALTKARKPIFVFIFLELLRIIVIIRVFLFSYGLFLIIIILFVFFVRESLILLSALYRSVRSIGGLYGQILFFYSYNYYKKFIRFSQNFIIFNIKL
jgi:hypothetical protein